MSVVAPFIAELEEALRNQDEGRRTGVLERITALFIDDAERFSDEQIALFDDVLMHLIKRIELKALIRLGEALAPIHNAPSEVIRRLAYDDRIEVAGPILAQSKRLSLEELIQLAKSKGSAHLLAISARETIPVEVTNILVRRGDIEVKHQLAKNTGARFSEAAFQLMLQDVESDDVLAEKLGSRLDIPLDLLRQLLLRATQTVHRRLAATAPAEKHEQIQIALASIAHEVGWEAMRPRDFSRATLIVQEINEGGRLSEGVVERFARERKYEEMVVALSLLSACPLRIVEPLIKNVLPDGSLVVCKAAGLEWQATKAVLNNRFSHHSMAELDLARAKHSFTMLSSKAARTALNFWQARASI